MRKSYLDVPSLEHLIETEDLGIETLHPGGLALTRQLAQLCRVTTGDRVLEIAAGTGETACLLAVEFGARAVALDASALMVGRARRKAHRRGLGLFVVRADAHALPFATGTFDAVLCECALCHFEKRRVLREMRRVARPGGAVGVHDLAWQPEAPGALKRRLAELEEEEPETREGWRALFEETGLERIELLDRPEVIPEWRRATRSSLGVLGYVRTAMKVLWRWGATGLQRILAAERILASPHLGYVIAVGRKPGRDGV